MYAEVGRDGGGVCTLKAAGREAAYASMSLRKLLIILAESSAGSGG